MTTISNFWFSHYHTAKGENELNNFEQKKRDIFSIYESPMDKLFFWVPCKCHNNQTADNHGSVPLSAVIMEISPYTDIQYWWCPFLPSTFKSMGPAQIID